MHKYAHSHIAVFGVPLNNIKFIEYCEPENLLYSINMCIVWFTNYMVILCFSSMSIIDKDCYQITKY